MNHRLHDDGQWTATPGARVLLLLSCGFTLSCGAQGAVPATVAAAEKAATCTSAPGAPTGLVASGTVGLGTFLNWSPVAPPAGCTVSYTVFRNGTRIGTTTSNTSFPVTGLAHSSHCSRCAVSATRRAAVRQGPAISLEILAWVIAPPSPIAKPKPRTANQ